MGVPAEEAVVEEVGGGEGVGGAAGVILFGFDVAGFAPVGEVFELEVCVAVPFAEFHFLGGGEEGEDGAAVAEGFGDELVFFLKHVGGGFAFLDFAHVIDAVFLEDDGGVFVGVGLGFVADAEEAEAAGEAGDEGVGGVEVSVGGELEKHEGLRDEAVVGEDDGEGGGLITLGLLGGGGGEMAGGDVELLGGIGEVHVAAVLTLDVGEADHEADGAGGGGEESGAEGDGVGAAAAGEEGEGEGDAGGDGHDDQRGGRGLEVGGQVSMSGVGGAEGGDGDEPGEGEEGE